MIVHLKKIEVVGLFDDLNYEITDLDSSSVMFINAMNGMGKTTLLYMLDGLANLDWDIFRSTIYKTLTFTFTVQDSESSSEERTLIIEKDKEGHPTYRHLAGDEKEKFPASITRRASDEKVVELLAAQIPKIQRASCGRHWTINGNGHYDADEVLDELKSEVDDYYHSSNPIDFLNHWQVELISANRLKIEFGGTKKQRVSSSGHESRFGVDLASSSIINQIEEHFITAQGWSRTIERDFLDGLLSNAVKNAPSLDDLTNRLNAANELEKKVQRVGLYPDADFIELPERKIEPSEARIIDVFLQNKEKRIEPHKEFLERIELFETLVNSSMAPHKSIRLDGEEGIVAVSSTDKKIKLDQLSSGEQHLIILAYKLIFEIKKDSYVLIDEPELSMHLDWQLDFADNIESIGALRNQRFLCATHSPAIVDSRTADLKIVK